MAYTTNPYATAQQVYNALSLSPSAQSADAAWIASDLLPQAQAAIDTFVGYPFQTDGTPQAPTTRLFSGNDADQMLVDPLISLTQALEVSRTSYISYGGAGVVQTLTQTLDITADLLLGPDNASPAYLLSRASELPFYFGKQNYKISGVWGYNSVPPEVTRAAIRLVAHWYKMRDFNYTSLSGNPQYGYQKFDMGEMPPDVCAILAKYRFPVFLV